MLLQSSLVRGSFQHLLVISTQLFSYVQEAGHPWSFVSCGMLALHNRAVMKFLYCFGARIFTFIVFFFFSEIRIISANRQNKLTTLVAWNWEKNRNFKRENGLNVQLDISPFEAFPSSLTTGKLLFPEGVQAVLTY